MKKRISLLFMQFLLLFAMASTANAQTYSTYSVQRVFSQQEIDQMLAPIALYPDPLLSQILMAATYPTEVRQAAGWSRANPGWQGEQAVQAVQSYSWDPSVKSLVAFPQILSVMDARMDWTMNLGDAFLGQQQQVMDTIQYLRRKAIAAGTLRSGDHLRVTNQRQIIVIEPVTVQTVYVPYYNPIYVYGTWWWPNYAPVYWEPWPGYASPYGYNRGLAWGAGVPVSVGLFFGYFDWSHRHVYVRPHRRWHDLRHYDPKRRYQWQHDPGHRHGTPYRSETVRQRYARQAQVRDEAGSYRGRGTAAPSISTGSASRGRLPTQSTVKPTTTTTTMDRSRAAKTTSSTAATSTRIAPQPSRMTSTPAPTRTTTSTVSRPVRTEQRPTAFEGLDKGREVRKFSERGRTSSSQAGRSATERSGSNGHGMKPPAREQRPSASGPARQDGPPRSGRGGRD